MKKNISLSINPTYKCNNNCSFCYLNGLHNSKLLDLTILNNQLKELEKHYNITYIDVYGGEITLLDDDYNDDLLRICKTYTSNVSVVSNFVNLTQWLLNLDCNVGTSWDYKFRPNGDIILDNVDNYYKLTNKKVGVLLTSPKLYDCKDEVLKYMNRDSIFCYSLIPCMKTISNNIEYNFEKYEETVKYFITHPIKPFYNHKINEKRNLDAHLFINPNNEYVNVVYDENGYEMFKKVDIHSFNENIPSECLCCDKFDKCLNEHVDSYINDGYDCNGFSKLVDWYQNEGRFIK